VRPGRIRTCYLRSQRAWLRPEAPTSHATLPVELQAAPGVRVTTQQRPRSNRAAVKVRSRSHPKPPKVCAPDPHLEPATAFSVPHAARADPVLGQARTDPTPRSGPISGTPQRGTRGRRRPEPTPSLKPAHMSGTEFPTTLTLGVGPGRHPQHAPGALSWGGTSGLAFGCQNRPGQAAAGGAWSIPFLYVTFLLGILRVPRPGDLGPAGAVALGQDDE